MNNTYSRHQETSVWSLGTDARSAFITRTYLHLFIAILGFATIECIFFSTGIAEKIAGAMLGTSWLLVLGGFIVVSWIATHTAHNARSLGVQYLALAGFVFAESLIFVPLLYIAEKFAEGVIASAALVTLLGFGGLTAIAFVTRKDFSFLGGLLRWGFIIALVLIVASLIFGLRLGVFFSVAMIGLAGAAILYDTSNVLHHYPEDRYVGAALQLFASVALMFWYVLQFFLSMASDD